MDLDTNQLCPGGTGKKIRFCCKDLTRELDRIVRLIEGGQRRVALETIDKTLAAKGDRACLFALKAEVQSEAGDNEGAAATMAAFSQAFPENPTALAEGALAAIEGGRLADAADLLQSALEKSGDTIGEQIYAAYGVLAEAFLLQGNVLAARAHLLMQISLTRGRDPNPLAMLARIERALSAPSILKIDLDLIADAPAGAAWQGELDAALERANRGEWRRALQAMKSLAEKHPNSGALRKNIALLASHLGSQDASQAWRHYAETPSEAWEDRVEAEAIAQYLAGPSDDESIDAVKLLYGIRDIDRLTERLLSDPRIAGYEGDLRDLVEEGETPPKNSFSLLDRSGKLEGGAELTCDTVPNVLGEIYIYGKRTDRDARLEFETVRDQRWETAQRILAEAAGEWLGPAEGEEIIGHMSGTGAELSWRWRFPPDTPREQRVALVTEKRRTMLLERWPNLPRHFLAGRTPRDVASQEPYRTRVAGAILLLETSRQPMLVTFDFNELRAALGLPTNDPIDPNTVDVTSLSIVRLPRLQVEKLTDDDLVVAFRRVLATNQFEAADRLAREALRRESLGDKIDRLTIHRVLSQTSQSPAEAIDHLRRSRDLVIKRGQSPAPLLLEELRVRLLSGEGPEECSALVERLRKDHMREAGVAQGLFEILTEFGIINPAGRPLREKHEPSSAIPEPGVPAAAPASGLWTPDAASPPGEKKSKLWTPD